MTSLELLEKSILFQVSKLVGKVKAAKAIFVFSGRNHLGMKPTQRSRTEMEKKGFFQTLRSWSVQLCEPINPLFCISQLESHLCYLDQEKVLTQKLE